MARVEVRSQAWGTLWDLFGNVQVGRLASIDTTVYVADTGGAEVTAGNFYTGANGTLPGWVEEGDWTLTVGSDSYGAPAISGDVGARTSSLESAQAAVDADGGPAKLAAANEFTDDQTIHGHIYSGRDDAGAETQDFFWDNANFKLKTKGLLVADIGDTPDLGMRRQGPDNAAYDDAPVGLVSGETIGRLYFQGWGDNGIYPDDYDTPTSGQHQAVAVGARPTQDTGVITTTTASGTAISASTVGLTSVAGLAPEGQILLVADNATLMTVTYDSISGSVLQGCAGVTAVASTGNAVTSFKRGTEFFVYTTPNGTDLKREVAVFGQDGLFTLREKGIEITTGNITMRNGWVRIAEVASVSTPDVNEAFLFVEDNGSGKTRIVARFATGADVVVATQP